jgi:nitrate reductase assembly molybdenum cofactor insertion protein NarJ
MKPLKNIIQAQLKDLQADNAKTVIAAIEKLREIGDESVIVPIINTLVNHPLEDVKNAASHFLFDLRDAKVLPTLISEIQNPDNKEYQRILVSACWESSMNCSAYLPFFVDLAIISDYMVCLECLTVIENMEGPFELQEINDAIEKVKNAVDEDEEGKYELLNSIWEVLVDIRASMDENSYTFSEN